MLTETLDKFANLRVAPRPGIRTAFDGLLEHYRLGAAVGEIFGHISPDSQSALCPDRFLAGQYLELLQDTGRWPAAWISNGADWGIAARSGDEIARFFLDDAIVPAYAFSGAVLPFDMGDPDLSAVMASIDCHTAAGGRAILFQDTILIQVNAPQTSNPRVVLFGGWALDDEGWHPFLLSEGGLADVFEQSEKFTSNRIQRGTFFDRGHALSKILSGVSGYTLARQNYPDMLADPTDLHLVEVEADWSTLVPFSAR